MHTKPIRNNLKIAHVKKAQTCSLFRERKNSFTENELSVLNWEFTCRELLSTTKITHKISSHNSHIPVSLSLFHSRFTWLCEIITIYIQKICWRNQIQLSYPRMFPLIWLVKNILQSLFETYSAVFCNVRRPSKF